MNISDSNEIVSSFSVRFFNILNIGSQSFIEIYIFYANFILILSVMLCVYSLIMSISLSLIVFKKFVVFHILVSSHVISYSWLVHGTKEFEKDRLVFHFKQTVNEVQAHALISCNFLLPCTQFSFNISTSVHFTSFQRSEHSGYRFHIPHNSLNN